jgi:hypothetical protein
MKKRFRFTMDLEVDMKEQVCKCRANSDKINGFLKEFLKDDSAILERYKVYLLCDLQFDTHLCNIQKSLGIPDPINDDKTYTGVLKKCPADVKRHFLRLFRTEEAWDSDDFMAFQDTLGDLTFKGASLEEVGE